MLQNSSTQSVFKLQGLSNTISLQTARWALSRIHGMDYKREIGKRLRAERDKLDISLEELQTRLGNKLSKSRVSNYEQGLRLPKPGEIKILADFYGVPGSYLMCLDEDGDMNQEEMDFLRNYRRLPENERKAYARRIQVMALAYRDPLPDEKLPKTYRVRPRIARMKRARTA